jgi:hypothetical protein
MQLLLRDCMTYFIVAWTAIGTGCAENTIPRSFTGRCLVTAGCCYSTILALSKCATNTLFLISILKNNMHGCSSMNTAGLRVLSKQIREFPSLTSLTSQDLDLQQGASQLQTASAHLWTFSMNIPSPWGYIFLCLFVLSSWFQLRQYATCIVSLSRVSFLVQF